MPQTKTLVLSQAEVKLKIQRIAWDIYEKHIDADKIILVGIAKSGFWLAQQLQKVLKAISDQQIELVEKMLKKVTIN